MKNLIQVNFYHYELEDGTTVDLDLVFNEATQMYEVIKPKNSVIRGCIQQSEVTLNTKEH